MPQTGSDLVSAGYPTGFPNYALMGGFANVASPNVPTRSNLEWLGLSSATNTALAGSSVANVVAVPVAPGTVVTRVSALVGTAASVPTHAFAALYAGTGSAPALIAQTTDTGTAAIAVNSLWSQTFASPVAVSPLQAPFGYVYVALSTTATTPPSVISAAVPAAFNTVWNGAQTATGSLIANTPLYLSMSAGSSLAGVAAATIASPSSVATAPIVFLS